jgi:hypothetical protein
MPKFGRFYTKEQWLVAKFPKAQNREFFSPRQGKSDGRTGSSARASIDCGLSEPSGYRPFRIKISGQTIERKNFHQPVRGRERKMQRFKSPGSA